MGFLFLKEKWFWASRKAHDFYAKTSFFQRDICLFKRFYLFIEEFQSGKNTFEKQYLILKKAIFLGLERKEQTFF